MRTWSRWLRRYRDDHDLTQEELGEVLGVDGKMVSAWENGQRPGRRHSRTICSALKTTRSALGLVEPEAPREPPVVGRRDFIRMSAGVGSLALFGPWAGVERVDPAAMDGFEATTEMLQQLWVRVGAAATLGPALGHVEAVTRLLQGTLTAEVRPRLLAVLAESSALLGVCKRWMGDAEGGDHFAAVALDAARETGDPDLAAHVVLAATWADRALDDAERLARYADGDHGVAIAAAGPATRAWASVLSADVHAARGDAAAALAALDEAAGLLSGVGEDAARRYPWPDAAWLAGERGVSLARLGRVAEARQALGAALSGTGDERAADRLRWMLAAAWTYRDDGEPEHAARIAAEVLRAAQRLRHGPLEAEVRGAFELGMGSE